MSSASAYNPAKNNKDTYDFLDHIFEGKLLPKHLINNEEKHRKYLNMMIENGLYFPPLESDINIIFNKNVNYTMPESDLKYILYSLTDTNYKCPKELFDLYGYYITNVSKIHSKKENERIVVLPYDYYEKNIKKNGIVDNDIKSSIQSSTHCILFAYTNNMKKLCFYDLTNVASELHKVKFYVFLCFFTDFYVFLRIFMFFYGFLCFFTDFYVFLLIFMFFY